MSTTKILWDAYLDIGNWDDKKGLQKDSFIRGIHQTGYRVFEEGHLRCMCEHYKDMEDDRLLGNCKGTT
jgi:hypothetical protein